MKRLIFILILGLAFISCNNNKNKPIVNTDPPQHWNSYPTGTPFYEYGTTNPTGKNCSGLPVTSSLLWSNNDKAMYISSIISGGKQVCININGNIIGPIHSKEEGQVIPINLYIPKDVSITIINDYNSLIVSGIKY